MAAQNDGLLVMMAPTPIVYAGFEETVDEDGVIGFRVAVDEERSRFWRHTRNRVFPRRNQVNEDGTPVYGAVSYTHLDVYKRQTPGLKLALKISKSPSSTLPSLLRSALLQATPGEA